MPVKSNTTILNISYLFHFWQLRSVGENALGADFERSDQKLDLPDADLDKQSKGNDWQRGILSAARTKLNHNLSDSCITAHVAKEGLHPLARQ